MIYKTTSIKKIITKVLDDLDFNESNIRVSSIITWASEALEKIGAYPWYNTNVAGKENEPALEVNNYQAKLPCGFHNLIQVAYSSTDEGPFYPMRRATGSFDSKRTLESSTTTTSSNANTDTSPESRIVTLAMELYDETYSVALSRINSDPILSTKLSSLLSDTSANSTTEGSTNFTYDLTYIIQGNYIKTNVSSGYLMMAYLAIPLDKEGLPLVPDYPEFFEALYWYVTMKLMYPMWYRGQIRDAVYMDAKRSWNYYCKQAYGKAMMPSGHELETIKNTWVRLVDNYTEHDTFFSTLGEREIIY